MEKHSFAALHEKHIGPVFGACGICFQELTDEQKDGFLIDDILVVDKIAEMFILGCTVDYVKEFGGSYLKVVNPNATAQCGCGESFAV